jgi:hypothetical protein
MSSPGTAALRVGACIDFDGARFDVVELAGRRLILREAGTDRVRQVDLGWLLSHPTTRVVGVDVLMVPAAAVAFAELNEAEQAEVAARCDHVREVITGFRRGSAELALPGEPRTPYRAGSAMLTRYTAKAAELGVAVSTVRRWVGAFRASGPAGLIRTPSGPARAGWGRTDGRWIDMCRTVLAEHVRASRPTRAIILAEVTARFAETHGEGVVSGPARTVGYEVLRELARGSNAFAGSTKGKRSIAERPQEVYGRLRATRPGEYVLLDTTRLDVFAMEAVTCRWVGPVSKSGQKPFVDHGDVDGGFVAGGEFVVAGGHGAVAFEAVDAALHGVALLVDAGVEARWSAALGPFLAPVGVLVGLAGDGGLDPASAQVAAVRPRGVRLIGQHPVRPGARATPPRRGTRMPSRTTLNCGLSPRCPAVNSIDNGFWPCSQARCSFVVHPPRDRPNA